MSTGIRLREVVVGFGPKRVLRGVDLDVPAGTTTVLLGANGTGKSTLVRACAGIVPLERGRIDVAGLDPRSGQRALLARVGFVPDVPDVWPWMSLHAWLRTLAPHFATWSMARAYEFAGRLDVPLWKPFGELSRGQGMKAMLVAALAHDPDVMLLDEPFGGIDVMTRERILRSVIGVLEESARTVLVTTHDLETAARIADRVAVLADGRIEREGPLAEIGGEVVSARGLRDALAATSVQGGAA